MLFLYFILFVFLSDKIWLRSVEFLELKLEIWIEGNYISCFLIIGKMYFCFFVSKCFVFFSYY